MTRDRYKIGKISSLMGITSEALRFYEHEGVITPHKSSQSGYRMYDAWDVHMLIRTRAYRQYGFSLAETVAALDTEDFDQIEAKLEEKEEALRHEIFDMRMKLRQLEYDRYTLRDCLMNVGKYRIEQNHAMHFIETQDRYHIMDDKFDFYHDWIEKVPYVTSGGIFEEDALHFGLMIADMNILPEDEALLEGTVAIPAQQCLVTYFRSGSEQELSINNFKPAYEYLQAHGCAPTAAPFAKAALMTKGDKEGVYYSWYKGWIPFEGDMEFATPPIINESDKPFSYKIGEGMQTFRR